MALKILKFVSWVKLTFSWQKKIIKLSQKMEIIEITIFQPNFQNEDYYFGLLRFSLLNPFLCVLAVAVCVCYYQRNSINYSQI